MKAEGCGLVRDTLVETNFMLGQDNVQEVVPEVLESQENTKNVDAMYARN